MKIGCCSLNNITCIICAIVNICVWSCLVLGGDKKAVLLFFLILYLDWSHSLTITVYGSFSQNYMLLIDKIIQFIKVRVIIHCLSHVCWFIVIRSLNIWKNFLDSWIISRGNNHISKIFIDTWGSIIHMIVLSKSICHK